LTLRAVGSIPTRFRHWRPAAQVDTLGSRAFISVGSIDATLVWHIEFAEG
jgi:hypothetical protein